MRYVRKLPAGLGLPSAIFACALLAGCSGTPKPSASALAKPAPAAPAPDAAAGWTSREQVGKAIDLLGRGEAAAARAILTEVLQRQPNDSIAASLMRQLDEDPAKMLGAESFAYTTREGDTMSSLAGEYLGNPTLFYALSRYNGIDVPKSLEAGRKIRIPGTRKIETAKPQPRGGSEKTRTAENKPAAVAPAPAGTPALSSPARAAKLRAAGLVQMNRGAIDRAVALFQQASRLDPANPLIRRDLDRAMRIRSAVQGKS